MSNTNQLQISLRKCIVSTSLIAIGFAMMLHGYRAFNLAGIFGGILLASGACCFMILSGASLARIHVVICWFTWWIPCAWAVAYNIWASPIGRSISINNFVLAIRTLGIASILGFLVLITVSIDLFNRNNSTRLRTSLAAFFGAIPGIIAIIYWVS